MFRWFWCLGFPNDFEMLLRMFRSFWNAAAAEVGMDRTSLGSFLFWYAHFDRLDLPPERCLGPTGSPAGIRMSQLLNYAPQGISFGFPVGNK